ncbi:MAG: HAMP domain-containing histidine kinase [Epsilonproteobacteria bacterium]|nr:HAMP domain-containing histidine kinase [Campylobacterota bacterium]
MFYNIKINIAVFYIVTTFLYVYLFYYLYVDLHVNLYLSASVIILLVFLSAFLIAKLSTDPLIEYIETLKALSTQTLHELNLPIATIQTNVSMIKRKIEDEKMLKRLSRIDEATQMLLQRYNELDHLIKTQQMMKIKECFDIKEILEKRVEFIRNLYPSHHFELNIESKKILNDPFGLSKVIDNLLQNSVKYSQKNSKITISFKNDTLEIIDEGQGIDEVELIKIFDSFYQSKKNSQGFGIGLFMVKEFCDKNDIELQIHSKVDHGTTIKLRFKGHECNQ